LPLIASVDAAKLNSVQFCSFRSLCSIHADFIVAYSDIINLL